MSFLVDVYPKEIVAGVPPFAPRLINTITLSIKQGDSASASDAIWYRATVSRPEWFFIARSNGVLLPNEYSNFEVSTKDGIDPSTAPKLGDTATLTIEFRKADDSSPSNGKNPFLSSPPADANIRRTLTIFFRKPSDSDFLIQRDNPQVAHISLKPSSSSPASVPISFASSMSAGPPAIQSSSHLTFSSHAASSGPSPAPVSVTLGCQCQRDFQLQDMFVCLQCPRLLCRLCTTETVETFFCPQCLQEQYYSESQRNGNRCLQCCECPQCDATLSIAVRSQPVAPVPEGQPQPAPISEFYFYCEHCTWSSLSLGLVDTRVQSLLGQVAAQEKGTVQEQNFKSLLTHFTELQSKALKEARASAAPSAASASATFPTSRLLRSLSSSSILRHPPPAPISSPSLHHPHHHSMMTPQQLDDQLQRKQESLFNRPEPPSVQPCSRDTDLLAFLSSSSITHISSVAQRQSSGEEAQRDLRSLFPHRKHLLTRRSKRCSHCDKILVKLQPKPQAIKYDVSLFAMRFVPKFTITSLPKVWRQGSMHLVSVLVNSRLDVESTLRLKALEPPSASSSFTAEYEIIVPDIDLNIGARDELSEQLGEAIGAADEVPPADLVPGTESPYVSQKRLNRLWINIGVKIPSLGGEASAAAGNQVSIHRLSLSASLTFMDATFHKREVHFEFPIHISIA